MKTSALQRLWKGFGSSSNEGGGSFDAVLKPAEALYVIGDIHGRDDLLERLLQKISDHFQESALEFCRMVCVGDYVDRGDRSAQVLKRLFLLNQEYPEQVVCLVGNHEQMLIDFLREPETRGRRWFRNGGLQTLASFAVGGVSETSQEGDLVRSRDDLRAAMPKGMESWLCNLPMVFQSGNVTVTHAGADPRRCIDDQEPNALLWGSPDFLQTERQDGIWIVYGHRIVDKPMIAGGRISIDTGAYATNKLTAVSLFPSGEVAFLTTDT